MVWANGQIPLSELVHLGGDHYLDYGTYVKWLALVADVAENEGITLTITAGPNAYRWLSAQVDARNTACAAGNCGNAAVPSFSSHGGLFNGQMTMAIDVFNWVLLGKEKFYAYARKHGFTPGHFSWEPWHIINFSPVFEKPAKVAESASPAKADWKSKMETYLLTTGDQFYGKGQVIYTYPGYKKVFKSADEYNDWREIKVALAKQSNGYVPPALGSLKKLPDWRCKAILDANGV